MRSVEEWRGRTDDAMSPLRVKDRIRERQGNICALTVTAFAAGDVIEYDHIVPLWLGGTNTEGNLQAVLSHAHKAKTSTEAKVRAKVNRTRKSHFGLKKKSSLSHPRFKKLMDGTVVDRRTGEVVGGSSHEERET